MVQTYGIGGLRLKVQQWRQERIAAAEADRESRPWMSHTDYACARRSAEIDSVIVGQFLAWLAGRETGR